MDVNHAGVKDYGYSRTEFLKIMILDIRPPAEHERLRLRPEATMGDENDQDPWIQLTFDRCPGVSRFLQ